MAGSAAREHDAPARLTTRQVVECGGEVGEGELAIDGDLKGPRGHEAPEGVEHARVRDAQHRDQTHAVPRIVCMSNVGAGGSGTWFANRVVIPLFLRWLQPIIEDKDRMEAALRASCVEWVSVRLPNIVEGPEQPLRSSKDGRGIGLSITAASTARFLLQQVTASEWVRSAPSISN